LADGRWLVTDFCESASILAYEHRRFRPLQGERQSVPEPGAIPVCEWLLPPTFVVAMKGGAFDALVPRDDPRFGPSQMRATGDVLLFPESATPAEIVREILAACTATRV
jgi:hypothetical protein